MKIFIICLFITHSLFALNLKEKFLQAEAGTYVVTEQNQITSLLHLHTVSDDKLLFEEISIPSHQVDKIDWKEWVKEGARGHTAWILYEVDLKELVITECYSLSRRAWIPIEEMNAFLVPLLTLQLNFLSEEERIQRGPTKRAGEVGRGPWGPPQVVSSKKVKNPQYDVYTARWPHDDSNLSGKQLVLYFDKTHKEFPFPYWIQARQGALKFKIRAIDSGSGMHSSLSDIPRRAPSFRGGIKQGAGKVSLPLTLPTYYENLKLYAIDLTESPRITHAIPFEIERIRESVTLSIAEEKLSHLFISGHEYLWILSAEDFDVAVESPHLFKWTSDY
ncbi:MAG: hypothetical protein K1060chlam2_01362 [Chlamydiae bacterium]|nr:hypothetical protein [Chlamydiota bacterium]